MMSPQRVQQEKLHRQQQIAAGNIEKHKQGRQPKVWGESTAHNARTTAFRVFTWAKDEGILPENPLAGMKRPKPAPRQRAMSDEEFSKLHGNAGGPFADFLLALRETGARPKEIRCLLWSQVEDNRWVLKKHKTAKKVGKPRVIYLSETMREMMSKLKGNGHTHVFLNTEGQPWTTNAVRLQVGRLRSKLGLADDLLRVPGKARLRDKSDPERGKSAGCRGADGTHLAGDGQQGLRSPGRSARSPQRRRGPDQPSFQARRRRSGFNSEKGPTCEPTEAWAEGPR